jgi:hypothetical protein
MVDNKGKSANKLESCFHAMTLKHQSLSIHIKATAQQFIFNVKIM